MSIFDSKLWRRLRPASSFEQFRLVGLLSLLVAGGCVVMGFHEAHACSVDYPHDGQCGLAAMMGYLIAPIGFVATFVLGSIAIVVHRKYFGEEPGGD